MVLTEPDVRSARQAAPSPTLPRIDPQLLERPIRRRRKPVREAISLTLYLVGAAGKALVRRDRPNRAPKTRRVPVFHPRLPQATTRSRVVLHVVALVLLCVVALPYIASPGLRLAARPVAASLGMHSWDDLHQPSTLVAADGSTITQVHDGISRRVVRLADVPEVVRRAVIAAEDKRFWRHNGYDAEAVGRAVVANLRAGGVAQGASTITQQLAKQNFVGDETSIVRKGKELLYAVALEEKYSKEELLERYLNQVYFGAGAYGVAAAAEEFFGTDLSRLTVAQAALLAGVIRAPAALDPRTAPAAATARRNEVLRSMAQAGDISGADATAAAATPLTVVPARPKPNPEPFVTEAVKREFLANPAFGETEDGRRRLLQTGGLRIETTIDLSLQAAARDATRWVAEGLGSAIVAVEPQSGRIVALHDGGAAATGHFDVATQGRRQPGSTFKPLVAAAALEAGLPEWQSLVGDGPIELDTPGPQRIWRVDNFDQADYGPVDLRGAVVDSVNTAFAQLAVALGADRITEMVRRLGIDVERALGPPDSRGPSMALGGLTHGVSPLELASAYGAFAAGGARVAPHLIQRVAGPDGRELYRAAPAPRPALDPAVNATLVDILQDAVTNGTGWAAALSDWEVLGKTGTSDGPADAWFVGAVPTLSTAVWVGRPDSEKPVAGLTGGSTSAPIWRAFMTEALSDRTPVEFTSVSTNRTNTTPLRLPQPRTASSG